ncbi:CRP/FNR family cyclic AMP-dependent transcriptional regulator [Brevundimonas vesicularis]|uniref:Crp/Fnr family transcriptional regulator n=1 Tax=Brevundimonas vesicularis TaxID=41276 RepID=UPI0018EAF286|nr:Crp/Fnr family transcriptional regulator [Brevundimonas vesicularis]MDQ1193841.1 CRP/FNR family cyclic AMP-dependent transcriptional regulator [Brevundimonas vesicularis]
MKTSDTLLDGDPWFADLTAVQRAAVLREATPMTARAGRRIYRCGDAGDGLYAVLEGTVRLAVQPKIGREITNLVLGRGDWFGELSLLDGQPRPHDAVAEADCRLLFVSQGRWMRLTGEDGHLWPALARLTARRHRQALTHLGRLLAQSPFARLAGVLLELATSDGAVRLSQDALATLVGVTRQTLNPLLRRMEEGRLIQRSYGCVSVRDREGLMQLSKDRS